MDFVHYDFYAGPEDVVEVSLDRQANVRLLDDWNFASYRREEHYTFYGGRALQSPLRLLPPRSGHWNLVIDLGGHGGPIRTGVRVIGRG